MSNTSTPQSPAPDEPAAGVWSFSPDLAVTGPDTAHARWVVVDLAAPAVPPRVLADAAAVIWSAVDGRRDTDGVVAEVAEQVGLEPDSVRTDVVTFLESLAADGLLRRTT